MIRPFGGEKKSSSPDVEGEKLTYGGRLAILASKSDCSLLSLPRYDMRRAIDEMFRAFSSSLDAWVAT
jgi:hypothetical protein